ncbi:cuticle protein 19-like [Rhodnius prolixus]|uniref:cuticle protein 19-like n=1 Tax=Rhodnius prolixus TaxID=13249 RepID=UPI003D18C1CE
MYTKEIIRSSMLVIAVLIAMVNAGPQFFNFPHQPHDPAEEVDFHAPAQYKFDYSVRDPHSGDVKSQWEHRDGDEVKGSYTVHDPDGTIRTVEYFADKDNGFNAIVKKEGNSYHPPIYGSKDEFLF